MAVARLLLFFLSVLWILLEGVEVAHWEVCESRWRRITAPNSTSCTGDEDDFVFEVIRHLLWTNAIVSKRK